MDKIRGLMLGANIFVCAVFGTATAPSGIALLRSVLGGESKLGSAIAAISLPSAVTAAVSFSLAIRAGSQRLQTLEGRVRDLNAAATSAASQGAQRRQGVWAPIWVHRYALPSKTPSGRRPSSSRLQAR
jgi:hypothetical protein